MELSSVPAVFCSGTAVAAADGTGSAGAASAKAETGSRVMHRQITSRILKNLFFMANPRFHLHYYSFRDIPGRNRAGPMVNTF